MKHEERELLFNEYISELKAAEAEAERVAKAKRDEHVSILSSSHYSLYCLVDSHWLRITLLCYNCFCVYGCILQDKLKEREREMRKRKEREEQEMKTKITN